jgi:hypothetical protein
VLLDTDPLSLSWLRIPPAALHFSPSRPDPAPAVGERRGGREEETTSADQSASSCVV